MDQNDKAKRERLTQLEEELKELKITFPEHCSGTKAYIGVHRADPQHLQRMEEIEDEIKALKADG